MPLTGIAEPTQVNAARISGNLLDMLGMTLPRDACSTSYQRFLELAVGGRALSIQCTLGESYLYSGEGYDYLQTVVTRLLRQPFETYMRARLLDPFRMRSSGYVRRPAFG